jgi:hypothetical protein
MGLALKVAVLPLALLAVQDSMEIGIVPVDADTSLCQSHGLGSLNEGRIRQWYRHDTTPVARVMSDKQARVW